MKETPRQKRLFSTLIHTSVAFAVCLTVLGCGPKEAKHPDTTFRVALLTPGPISDQAWNASAYHGLERLRDSLDASISHIQTKTPAEIEENFRQYGSQRYTLVFGNGFEFQDPSLRVAPEFPKTIFVNVSATKTAPNVAAIDFTFSDGAYLAGIVAGTNTKTNTIGVIGGQDIPPVAKAFKAFEAGAKSVNPQVQVLTSYIGNWDDVSAGKEQALAQIGRGADMIFQNADAAGLGVFQAARESQAKHVRIFGANSDQNAIAPEITLGSVVIDLAHAFLLVAREVKSGTFKSRMITLGAKDDVIRWVPNPSLANEITAPTQSKIDSVANLIRAGTLSPTVAQSTAP